MKNRYLEQMTRCYVIATLDRPTRYLISQNDQLAFTQNIIRCTKYMSRDIAEFVLEDSNIQVQFFDTEMVILPLMISYELIDESEEDYYEEVCMQ